MPSQPAPTTRKPRVVQILFSGLGGHASVAFPLVEAAQDAWDRHLIFFGAEPVAPAYEARCAALGVAYATVRTEAGRPSRSWPELAQTLAAIAPDIIILHSVKAVWPVWRHARRTGARLLAVEHQANALKSRAEWAVSAALPFLADRTILLTPDYERELTRRLGPLARRKRGAIIPNGIDTERFRPHRRTDLTKTGPIVVGMAGRFSATKRQDVLVEALAAMKRRPGGPDIRLSLAGNGTELECIRNLTTRLGVADQVTFPGFLDEAALCDWFTSLDIYAHASDGETLSTAILQAMAMGLPIAASDVAGIANLVDPGPSGLLASPNTAEAFAAAIHRLIDTPELARTLAGTARETVLAHYSRQAMFAGYQSLMRIDAPDHPPPSL